MKEIILMAFLASHIMSTLSPSQQLISDRLVL